MAWWSPAVHLYDVSRSSAASIQAATVAAGGKRCASTPPVRNFRWCSASATASAAASQSGVGPARGEGSGGGEPVGGRVGLRELDVHLGVGEPPVGTGGVDGGVDPADVA